MNQLNRLRCNLLYFFSIIFFLVLFTNCKKDVYSDNPSEIGSGILPGGDKYSLDTIKYQNIKAYSIKNRPFITNGLSNYCLGKIINPSSGTTTGVIIINFVAFEEAKVFKYYESLKSIDLFIKNTGYFGSDGKLWINVYKIKEFPEDTLSNVSFIKDELIGAFYSDTIPLNTTEIKIPIDSAFFKELLAKSETALSNQATFSEAAIFNQDTFNNVFKGLYIETSSLFNNGFLFIENATIEVDFYNKLNDEIVIKYLYKNDAIGKYEHNYTPIIENAFNDPNTDSLLYVQALGGVKAKIILPDLSSLRDSAITLNTAKIEVPVNYISSSDSNMFFQLAILNKDSLYIPIYDYYYMGGLTDKADYYNDSTNTYTFYFTLFLNYFLKSDDVDFIKELYITPNSVTETNGPKKWVFENSKSRPIKVTILYNKFD